MRAPQEWLTVRSMRSNCALPPSDVSSVHRTSEVSGTRLERLHHAASSASVAVSLRDKRIDFAPARYVGVALGMVAPISAR